MKQIAITGIAVLLVSMLCFFGLNLFEERAGHYGSAIKLQDLALALKRNRESINSLESTIIEIQRQLDQQDSRIKANIGPDTDAEYKGLLDTVDELELTVAKLALSADQSFRKRDGSLIEKRLSERLRRSVEIAQDHQSQNVIAESDFEADSGKPLGDFQNSIGEALHSVTGIEVSGTVCRDTICKVNYVENDLSGSRDEADIRSDLVDTLSQAAIGSAVEVSYANDASGNPVMYIQLR